MLALIGGCNTSREKAKPLSRQAFIPGVWWMGVTFFFLLWLFLAFVSSAQELRQFALPDKKGVDDGI